MSDPIVMSDQGILALIIAASSGLGSIVFFLFKNIKDSMTQLLNKTEGFVKEVAAIREDQAIKTTVLSYMQKELEIIKTQCWKCRDREIKSK